VEALNHALADIPAEQLRIHLCWGNYEGPHHCDVPLADIIVIVFLAKPHAISLEAANRVTPTNGSCSSASGCPRALPMDHCCSVREAEMAITTDVGSRPPTGAAGKSAGHTNVHPHTLRDSCDLAD
jgi:hypothetical protein